MSFAVANRDLVDALFDQISDTQFKCKLCITIRTQAPRKVYTNLVDHLARSHARVAVESAFDEVQRAGVLSSAFVDVSPVAKNTFCWIEWTVMENRELSFCEHKYVRKNSKLTKLSKPTMILCMEGWEELVRDNIVEKLRGKRVGFAFDAWTCNGYHFVAIISVVEKAVLDGKSREQFLLLFEPIDPNHYDAKKKLFHADAIIELFDVAIDRYRIDANQLCFLVGDNASVNGSIGRKIDLPLIGCASHRLNLAVEQHLALYDAEITKVEKLMRYLRTSKVRSVLRKLNGPTPLLNNTTRWSSTYLMLKRYKSIAKFIDSSSPELAPLLPTPEEHVRIISLLNDLSKFQSVCLKLQNADGVTLRDVRVLFDKLLDEFESAGSCTKHISIGAKVVAVPDFENGIVKVQDDRSRELTKAEKRALARFARTKTDVGEDEAGGALGFADAALHERRVSAEPQYGDLAWIPPTSDDVERLFSQAGMVYSDQRMSMLPDTLELILFLRFNRSLWNEVSVAQVLRRQEQSRKRKRQLTLFEDGQALV